MVERLAEPFGRPAEERARAGVGTPRSRARRSAGVAGAVVPRTRVDPRDLRQGGRWSRSQTLRNLLLRWTIFAALRLADRLPPRLLLGCGRWLGWTAHQLAPSLRRRARGALLLASPQLPHRDRVRLVAQSFELAGENLARTLLLRRPAYDPAQQIRASPATRALLHQLRGSGRGVLFVCAHHGPFELIPPAVAGLGFRPAVVVRESYDPDLDPAVDAHRHLRGVEVIHRGRPGAALRILRALRRGQPVGLLPDLGARVESVEVEFLGAQQLAPVGPARLALRTGAALVVGWLCQSPVGGGPFELRTRLLTLREDEAQATGQIMAALEEVIRSAPEHWLWMARLHRLPPDASRRYRAPLEP